ncbi:MAG TPA: Trm112 family protein [Candidatus Bathyarchaeota archaeon]|nr:Trm112 family protein [Candidatus Bathyarchaeota archaeon]
MKYRLMDVLACPECKGFPLELIVLSERELEGVEAPEGFRCEEYCGLNRRFVRELEEEPDCKACFAREVVEGVLYCPSCGRWFPIIDELPRIFPDKLRESVMKEEDMAFLRKHADELPDKITREGKPYNLSTA